MSLLQLLPLEMKLYRPESYKIHWSCVFMLATAINLALELRQKEADIQKTRFSLAYWRRTYYQKH